MRELYEQTYGEHYGRLEGKHEGIALSMSTEKIAFSVSTSPFAFSISTVATATAGSTVESDHIDASGRAAAELFYTVRPTLSRPG
jgi:hypothetical protein